MGRSFFGGTDAELYSLSDAFARQISGDPGSFGLSALQAADYQALNDNYREKYLTAIARATRTPGTVSAKNDAREKLRAMASDLARIIRDTSSVTGEQKIGLGLSVSGAPAAVGELGEPTQCSFTIGGIGELILKWKCVNPRATGTVYQIWRSITSTDAQSGRKISGPFVFLGISGKRKFTDYTLPPGSSKLIYKIQAVRSTAIGPEATFNVNFGVSSSYAAIVAMAQARQAKFAA